MGLMAFVVATHVLAIPDYALAKGGYMRPPDPKPVEASIIPHPKLSIPRLSPKHLLGGCGRGAIRDPQTHKCRGPGDIGN